MKKINIKTQENKRYKEEIAMNSTLLVAIYDVDELHSTNNDKLRPAENKIWFINPFLPDVPF